MSEKEKNKRVKQIEKNDVESLFDKNRAKNFIKTLNQEQKLSSISKDSHNLIIASAGTGKTSTIVARIIYLLNQNILPREIMLITFTSKAATEMRERMQRYIDKKIVEQILVGTFHSTAIHLLKKNNVPFTLNVGKGMQSLFSLTYQRFIQSHPFSNDEAYISKTLFELQSVYLAKSNGKSFQQWFIDEYPSRENQLDHLDKYESIIELHQENLKKEKLIGFNELLIKASVESQKFTQKFKEIIIDEYQDTSYLQIQYAQSLPHKQLFCVGDYDQSIYAFNGANIEIIASFGKMYKNSKIFNLKKNYRSNKPILDLAQKVISQNKRIFPKKLEIMNKSEEFPIIFTPYLDDEGQAFEIAKKIKESKTFFDNIAIIYRNNSSATNIEIALKENNIECIRDDKNSFFDIDEVRYTINVLKLLNGLEKIALLEILDVFHLSKYSHLIADTLLGHERSIKDAILYPKGNFKFSVKDKDEFFLKHHLNKKLQNKKISNLFYELYKIMLLHKRLNTKDFLTQLFDSTFISESMKKFAEDKSVNKSNDFDGLKFKINLGNFNKWQEKLHEAIDAFGDIEKFINSLSHKKEKNDREKKAVHLLTIHASKGLEFEDVYLIDLNDKKFPNEKLMKNGGGGIEEERRLFYVVITRAKKRLELSWCLKHSGKTLLPSSFLKGLIP